MFFIEKVSKEEEDDAASYRVQWKDGERKEWRELLKFIFGSSKCQEVTGSNFIPVLFLSKTYANFIAYLISCQKYGSSNF